MEKIDIEIPEMLDFPPELLQLLVKINDYRYFLIEGGRGGAKSQSVGRLFLYLIEKLRLRAVCGREIQRSIQESVYSLLIDIINKYRLNISVFKNCILHRGSRSIVNFRGFREQGAFNIQGMEGIDLVWIDEAQAITKATLDVLIPTIRKNQAKIFFTMNRHVADDPVYEFCKDREDCLHIHINYDQNKHCTEALIHEAEECLRKSEDDYRHIWLGEPLAQDDNAVFAMEELEGTAHNRKAPNPHYGFKVGGFDIARFGDDKCAAVILEQRGALNWEVTHVEDWGKKDLNWTTGRILEIFRDYRLDRAIVDVDGLGAGPFDALKFGRKMDEFVEFRNPALSYDKNKEYADNRTANTYLLKDMVRKGHLVMTNVELMKELCSMRYTFDHQQRRELISKKMMKEKYKVKSPNLADAAIMAVSLVPTVRNEQDTQYVRRGMRPNVSRENSLFKIAGVK